MLELVKAQKFPKAAGAEDTFIIDPHKLGETMYSEWGNAWIMRIMRSAKSRRSLPGSMLESL